MEGGDRSVVIKPMVTTNNAKTHDMPVVVKNLQPLGAGSGWQTRHHVDFSKSTHVTVAENNVTAFEEVLVRLRVVEATDDGPDGGDGGGDGLDDGGGAPVRSDGVGVVVHEIFRDPDGRWKSPYGRSSGLFVVVYGGCGGGCGGGGGGGLDSLNLKRRMHDSGEDRADDDDDTI
ncbi:hypothetical protein R6Q57_005205 [Mikania cordata]